jgi:glycosyltransferase involved in cell wall biosynthesis
MMESEPIRVLRIIDRLNVGGPTKHVTWLGAGLAPFRIRTTLVTGTIAPGEGDMSWFARERGARPVPIPSMSRALRPGDVFVVGKLLRMMLLLRPDVVHTHKAKAGAVGRAAAFLYRWGTPRTLIGRPRRVRVVHTFHGHVFHGYYGASTTRVFVAIERLLGHWATDRIITLSERQRSDIVDTYRVAPSDKVMVVPLGLEIPPRPPARGKLRAELELRPGESLVGIVGRLCEVKNHAMLLDAMERLVADGMSIRLVIVGDGHLRESLEARVATSRLRGKVHFLGFRESMSELYADFDVVALTSQNEGTPLTLLEAMSCGRSVMATAVGGVPDIMGGPARIDDGFAVWGHGVTAASGDVDGYARGLRWLLERPAIRAVMGERGRDFVAERMSVDRLVHDMGRLYEELAGRRAAIVVDEVDDEGADHGRSGVHRLASGGALPRTG